MILYVTCCLFTNVTSRICHIFVLVPAMNNSVISQLQLKVVCCTSFFCWDQEQWARSVQVFCHLWFCHHQHSRLPHQLMALVNPVVSSQLVVLKLKNLPHQQSLILSYKVKFINPKRKSDYTTRTWYDTSEKFNMINSLR